MSTEHNIAIVRRFIREVISEGNLDAVDEVLAPDVIFSAVTMGNLVERRGPATFKAVMASLHTAWSEIHARPLLMIVEGDVVACQVEIQGRHHQGSGAWRSIPPTGKDATWTGYRIFRLTDGRIAEIRSMEDEFGLLAQLGATITVSHPEATDHHDHPDPQAANPCGRQSDVPSV